MRVLISLAFLISTYISFGQENTGDLPGYQLKLSDKISIIISSFALVISALTFFFAWYQDWKSARGEVIKAFQGEKEAVAYIAYKVRSKRWNRRFEHKKFRQEVITALCLAWSLESADRAKAIIFDTLKEVKTQGFINDIQAVLQKMHLQFINYKKSFQPSKFDHRITDLEALMKELEIQIL